jgi:hypothetical protein
MTSKLEGTPEEGGEQREINRLSERIDLDLELVNS